MKCINSRGTTIASFHWPVRISLSRLKCLTSNKLDNLIDNVTDLKKSKEIVLYALCKWREKFVRNNAAFDCRIIHVSKLYLI